MNIKKWKECPGDFRRTKEQTGNPGWKTKNDQGYSQLDISDCSRSGVCHGLVGILMFQSVTIQESAMEPTLSVGDHLFVNRVVYKLSSPKRGDMIVFKTNGSDDAALHISRVIGLPGETVQISDGKVLINGEVYEENGNFPDITNREGWPADSVSLESGEYFVLGDNRNNSEDSRYADIGNVNRKYIVGKLWFTISPRDKSGIFERLGIYERINGTLVI